MGACRTLIVCALLLSLSDCAGGEVRIGSGMQQPAAGAGANPLSYVTWGPWSAGGNVGAPPMGSTTPVSDVPKTGTAQYTGSVYATSGHTGSTTIGVDFANGSVNMGITIPN